MTIEMYRVMIYDEKVEIQPVNIPAYNWLEDEYSEDEDGNVVFITYCKTLETVRELCRDMLGWE